MNGDLVGGLCLIAAALLILLARPALALLSVLAAGLAAWLGLDSAP